MRQPKLRGARLSARPFYTVLLLFSIFTAYSFLSHTTARSHSRYDDADLQLLKRGDGKLECADVHHAQDQCAFIKEYCVDDDAGLLPYLHFYYCTAAKAKPVAFAVLVVWLGLLFSTIGIAASDFFSVNLSTIATILGLSESLAGVTFLAFGNGSPDVFSTFAAMSSNSASMAVGELLGAACFITGVVAGSMALVREFKVDKKSYARDICFFIVAVAFTMFFLADGHLRFWECCVMIGYYVVYVITVVCLHWYNTRKRRRLRREGEARSHFYGAVSQGGDELAGEPYRDDPDEAGGNNTPSVHPSTVDLESSEIRPRIEIDGLEAQSDMSPEGSDEDHERMIAAEVASSMRVLRTRGRRSNTTITPIRPSLVGALEFRSALAQLQRESNHKMVTVPDRAYYDDDGEGSSRRRARSAVPDLAPGDRPTPLLAGPGDEGSARGRAWSSGDTPVYQELAPDIAVTEQDDLHMAKSRPAISRSETAESLLRPQPYTVGGSLAPPPKDATGHAASGTSTPASESSAHASPRLMLQIPSRKSSYSDRSSPASPFPNYTDSPLVITPQPHNDVPDFSLPGPARRDTPLLDLQVPVDGPRPVQWWPYSVLPPPHVMLATMFPTLQGWSDKTYWDKLISAITVPSIFLLVVTLPVVESDTTSGSSMLETIKDNASALHLAPPVSNEPEAIEPHSEWERYRRHTLSRNNSYQSYRDSSQPPSPRMTASVSPETTLVAQQSSTLADRPSYDQGGKAVLTPSAASVNLEVSDDVPGWSRWLVCMQLFTGPLFAVLVLWANMREDWTNPNRVLVRMILWTLLGSLVGLSWLLLSTSEQRKPKYHYLLCFLGFVISIAWISTIAGEVVGVLKTFGVVLGISEALLGLTIFAAGNSVGDLVADITVARLGYPVMALSACFGGPMLNILLGIGIGGVLMMVRKANHKHHKHPDRPYEYGPYRVQVGGTLMISAITLLVILAGLLIAVPMNKWVLSRKIGWTLIGMWTLSTIINVAVEVSGVWGEMA